MMALTHSTETKWLAIGIYTMVEEISHGIIFISKFWSLKYNLNTIQNTKYKIQSKHIHMCKKNIRTDKK